MKIIATGGRHFADWRLAFATFDALLIETAGDLIVIEGGATGLDALAREWRNRNGVPGRTYKARWRDMSEPCRRKLDKYGRPYNALAGHRRNALMLRSERPDLVVAFTGGPGTADMVALAHDAGVAVREIGR